MLLLLACAAPPEGLRETPDGSGPVVTIDWDAKPLADIPFPSDLATRPDPTSPTGLRLNVPMEATTHQEEETRAKLDELTGWGIYAPITVGFSAPLDLDDILARHRDDPRDGIARYDDDAILVLDVTPGSPTYGQPVALDLGEGRFPMDAARSDRYFPNDSRAAEPSLLFDTVDEDLNGNGVLDWGEDSDADGRLDFPNVWPTGGDHRADLLSWYELATDTLVMRPVVPLREETTYAVVLTERLVGRDGAPVRSPWEYVHHLRQTEALRPLEDILPRYGLGIDDVAFAWTYTTANVTGDLVDIHRGLEGEGPFAGLAAEYPAAIEEALQVHEMASVPDHARLPVGILVSTLSDLGLFSGESADAIVENYEAFGDVVVGGSFTTPYFLADRDDNGRDDSDEWFLLDAYAGSWSAEPQRVAFTCVLPKRAEGDTTPAPVAFFGHGYGSSRFDFLGFSWAFNRMGMAACAMDFPGHGPTVDADQLALIEAYLSGLGLLPFLDHLNDSRQRDLNNDGNPESGGDQWSADAFHTRDMVRQAAVDWMQIVHAVRGCGTGTMTSPDGDRVTCDWDGDGIPDMGGPDAPIYIVGGSLGGINSGVAAAVIPEVTAWAPIASGGGLIDVAVRTQIGGAVEAMAGRLMSPLVLGRPDGAGGLRVTQMVNSVTDMVELDIGTLSSVPANGRIEVENLDNGVIRESWIPEDGAFRVGIAADALDPFEKAVATGMPTTGPVAGTVYEVADNEGLGDHLVVRVYDASGALVQTFDTFATDVLHEGVTMRAGSPLVAASHGLGHIRATPEVRRLVSAMAGILEPGDAISYAPHYVLEPYEELGGRPVPVLIVPTPGDSIVNINTGVAHARAAGFISQDNDGRYGMPVDRWLAQRGVLQGLEEYGGQVNDQGVAVLFDPDDLDAGTDSFGAPSDAPLRATWTDGTHMGGLRMPYVSPSGQHGFGLPEPSRSFDINTFEILQVATFLASGGRLLSDDPCLATASCAWIPQLEDAP